MQPGRRGVPGASGVPPEGFALDRDKITNSLQQLAKRFRVSTLVALRRLYDANFITETQYRDEYSDELARVLAIMGERNEGASGGSFYNTQPVRMSKRFTRALIESTLGKGKRSAATRLRCSASRRPLRSKSWPPGWGLSRWHTCSTPTSSSKPRTTHYAFDVVPGFWDWLDREHSSGNLYSIENVRDELIGGDDDLAEWAKARGSDFFLPIDDEDLPSLADVIASWARSGYYEGAAANTFLSVPITSWWPTLTRTGSTL